jgi:hypothetical protein
VSYEILDEIPFKPRLGLLQKHLRMTPGDEFESELKELLASAVSVARPKAVYRLIPVTGRAQNSVTLGDKTFESQVMHVNLAKTNRVFAYVATCGREIEAWARQISDPLQSYWADCIQEFALRAAMDYFRKHLIQKYQLQNTNVMSPGSLEDWPIQMQRPLFDLLGAPVDEIGVELTESFLMLPHKSVSGIRFESESRFESCELCPREDCPNRRKKYDPAVFNDRARQMVN